jgi:hypothetical protein
VAAVVAHPIQAGAIPAGAVERRIRVEGLQAAVERRMAAEVLPAVVVEAERRIAEAVEEAAALIAAVAAAISD